MNLSQCAKSKRPYAGTCENFHFHRSTKILTILINEGTPYLNSTEKRNIIN